MILSIRTYHPAPSFNQDKVTVEVKTLDEAIEIARASFAETKRTTEIYFGEFGSWCLWSVSGWTGKEERNSK